MTTHEHEWERIDQGEAYCISCDMSTNPFTNLTGTMKTNEQGHVVIVTDRPAGNKTPDCVKNVEIEKIKRQLYNLIDRVEQLKSK